jgi:Kef-type K+ transport system membrane component KefB
MVAFTRLLAFVFFKHDDWTLTLLGVAVVVLAAALVGRLFARIGQPPVIGEVIAGIALGPSVLGHYSNVLYPLEARPLLKMLSTFGLVTFMFLVGLELNLGHLDRSRHRVAGGVALAGTVIPFGLGLLLAFPLYASHNQVDFLPFALFVGAAMSITAFPVLARIMIERNLYAKPLGVVAMACAAGDDVLTWATLALVIAIISSSSHLDLPYICALAIAFGALMIGVVRPRLRRFTDHAATPIVLSLVVVGFLTASFVTSTIGVHEIFGAFLAGAIFPRGALARQVAEKLGVVAMILLPVFFVSTGLNVDIGGVGVAGIWQFGLILFVACAGKFLGGIVGARSQGLRMRESVALGVLMNTRGLTELIVLNIGLTLGILDTSLFTLLVLMAVVTTVATGPLLNIVKPDPYLGRAPDGEEEAGTLVDLSLGASSTGPEAGTSVVDAPS